MHSRYSVSVDGPYHGWPKGQKVCEGGSKTVLEKQAHGLLGAGGGGSCIVGSLVFAGWGCSHTLREDP